MGFGSDIFDFGILSDSCRTSCNCHNQFESQDSAGQKDQAGGAAK